MRTTIPPVHQRATNHPHFLPRSNAPAWERSSCRSAARAARHLIMQNQGLADFHGSATIHFGGVIGVPGTYGKRTDHQRAFFLPASASFRQLFTGEGRWMNSAQTTMPDEQPNTGQRDQFVVAVERLVRNPCRAARPAHHPRGKEGHRLTPMAKIACSARQGTAPHCPQLRLHGISLVFAKSREKRLTEAVMTADDGIMTT